MLDRRVVSLVKGWIRSRRVWFVHFGTSCTAWSVTTPAKSRAGHFDLGVALAKVTLELVQLCSRYGVHWSIENPSESALWKWSPLQAMRHRLKARCFDFDCCQYGCRYKKPTRILTSLADLTCLARRCPGGHPHCRALSASPLKTALSDV